MQRKDFIIFENQLCRIRKKTGAPDITWAKQLRKLFRENAKISDKSLCKLHKKLHSTIANKDERKALLNAIIFELCLAVKLPEKIWSVLLDSGNFYLDLSNQDFTLGQLLAVGTILEFTQIIHISFSKNNLSSYLNCQLKALSSIFKHSTSLDLSNNNLDQMSENHLTLLLKAITGSEADEPLIGNNRMLTHLNISDNNLGNLNSPENASKWQKICNLFEKSRITNLEYKNNNLTDGQLRVLLTLLSKNIISYPRFHFPGLFMPHKLIEKKTNQQSRFRPTKLSPAF